MIRKANHFKVTGYSGQVTEGNRSFWLQPLTSNLQPNFTGGKIL